MLKQVFSLFKQCLSFEVSSISGTIYANYAQNYADIIVKAISKAHVLNGKHIFVAKCIAMASCYENFGLGNIMGGF